MTGDHSSQAEFVILIDHQLRVSPHTAVRWGIYEIAQFFLSPAMSDYQ